MISWVAAGEKGEAQAWSLHNDIEVSEFGFGFVQAIGTNCLKGTMGKRLYIYTYFTAHCALHYNTPYFSRDG